MLSITNGSLSLAQNILIRSELSAPVWQRSCALMTPAPAPAGPPPESKGQGSRTNNRNDISSDPGSTKGPVRNKWLKGL